MSQQDRIGNWMQTASGIAFYPLDPREEEIVIDDIAHALSNQCRYAGHCKYFYSVAEHSVWVSHHVAPENALWGLLHDAAEAYLVDVPKPIKPFLGGYDEYEDKLLQTIAKHFQLPTEMPADVKRVDAAILADEKKQLMAPESASWHLPEPPLNISLRCWSPEEAKRQFLWRYCELTNQRANWPLEVA